MLQETERQFKVTVVAKHSDQRLEYWVVLLNDHYDNNAKILDSIGKFSIFHSPNIEATVQEAQTWAKFLGVEVDLSSVESALTSKAAQLEEQFEVKTLAKSTTSSFGSLRKRSNVVMNN